MLKAADIMNKNVITVTSDTNIEELGRLFIENDISGAPVLDPSGRLVGMVTENDLIKRNKRLHIPTVLRIFDAFIPLERSSSIEKEIKEMSAATVEDICTKDIKSIAEDTPLDEIATIMIDQNMHHLPVLKDGKVIGIVGKHEVIKGIAGETSSPEP
jgi:CBS domain-containing protein